MNPELVDLLICPSCGSALRDRETHLECTACKSRFPIENGIPVLLVDRAPKNRP